MTVVYTVMIIQCLQIVGMFGLEEKNLYGGLVIGGKCELLQIMDLVAPSSFFWEDIAIKASALCF